MFTLMCKKHQLFPIIICFLFLAQPLTAQLSDLMMSVRFYEVRDQFYRGPNLQGNAKTNYAYFQWNGQRYVSNVNFYSLPFQRMMWVELQFTDRQAMQHLPIQNLALTTTGQLQYDRNHQMFLFQPTGRSDQSQITVEFANSGNRYHAVLDFNWNNTQVIPPTNSNITARSVPGSYDADYLSPGWSVQLAADKTLHSPARYREYLSYGSVYAAREGDWYKFRIGTFQDRATAVNVMNQVRRLPGRSSAFLVNHTSAVQAEWVEGATGQAPSSYDQLPATDRIQPLAPAMDSYAVQIASLNRQPRFNEFDHLQGYPVFYRQEGASYKVLVGPYAGVGTAMQARNELRRLYPSAFISREGVLNNQLAAQNPSSDLTARGTTGAIGRVLSDTPGPRVYESIPSNRIAAQPIARRTHEVQRGETLHRIALRYGLTVQQLRYLNDLADNALIFPDQLLFVE